MTTTIVSEPWCPCFCCNTCWEGSDNFNRGAGSPGGIWDQRSGSWSISNNQLVAPAQANALIVYKLTGCRESFRIAATAPNAAVNDVYRIIVNYRDDNNYHFAQFSVGNNSLTISLYKRSSGNNTQLLTKYFNDNATGEMEMYVCFVEGGIFFAGANNVFETWIEDPVPHANGCQAGLGNGGTQQIKFDDFLFAEHKKTHSDCDLCGCWCNDNVVNKAVTATCDLSGDLAQGCEEPFEVGLAWDSTLQGWTGSQALDCGNCMMQPDLTLELKMTCGSNNSGNGVFDVEAKVRDAANTVVGSGSSQSTSPTACDPLRICFASFTILEGAFCDPFGSNTNLAVEVNE